MSKLKFHKVAAVAVLVATAAWVATGEFTSVGSAATEEAATPTKPEAKPAPVRTVAVIDPPRLQHARAIKVSGYTDANQRASLAARAAGIIADLPVKLGTRVKAGDLIMRLDAEGKQAAVETARQLLSQREAETAAVQKLAQSGSVAKLQLDNALSALAAARSQLEAAQADLARNEVLAPFDGVVDKVSVELGSSIQVGSPVATVLNLNPILAIGEVSERDLSHVSTGHEADVRLVNGLEVKGTVRYVSHDATAATRTYRVEVAVPNDDGRIPAGMTAEITLRAEPVEATVLPRSVITLSAGGDLGIRAVDADNKVVFYPIDIVDDSPNGLVLGGIPADVKIIVAGQELITEGDTVKPVEADAETLKKLAGEAAGGTQ
ncbi:MAG: efflux RND transporter periplasmic adaptor subunit [Rhizobiales bacterium]|nr:efflux RND transporter periplasmic adaptor subunit [Hyphomicrobiales bacterium]OJU35489.1 MAG: efflux transporter periplasmic adaptor subunit [Rhizobiales bacterium 68-8]